jgi:hypothetical protein
MGTSEGYRGSSGEPWSRVRTDAGQLDPAPSEDDIARLVEDTLQAIGWESSQEEEVTEPDPGAVEQTRRDLHADHPPAGAAEPPRGTARTAPGRGVSLGGRPRGGGGTGAGGRRSVRRAARAAGRAIAAGYALQAGDARELADLGLSFDELQGLDPYGQCEAILEAFANGESIQDAELRLALVKVLRRIQESNGKIAVEEIVRAFIAEYVYRVLLTEVSARLRTRDLTPKDAGRLEHDISRYLHQRAARVKRPAAGSARRITPSEMEAAISQLFDDAREVFFG